MAWLKYTPVFKHGYGEVGYKEIYDMDCLEDIKSDIWREDGDPEGLRSPIWEMVDFPSRELLVNEIKDMQQRIEYWERKIEKYSEMLIRGEYD